MADKDDLVSSLFLSASFQLVPLLVTISSFLVTMDVLFACDASKKQVKVRENQKQCVCV